MATIERFEAYIKEQLKQSEENKMEKTEEIDMATQRIEEQRNPFDDLGGNFVKLEKDKAKVLLLTNWKIEEVEKFIDEKTGKLKKQKQFSADVLNEDGVNCNKKFDTTSVFAMIALGKIFSKDWPRNDIPHLVRIKKIGEGKGTIWDVEEQQSK